MSQFLCGESNLFAKMKPGNIVMSTARGLVYSLSVSLIVLAACTEAPQQPQEAAKKEEPPPEPIEGQKAFFQMYVAARGWATDAEGLRLESIRIPEVEPEGGRFGAWRGTFVSPSKMQMAIFNYSVVNSSGKFVKGVFQDHEEGYTSGRVKPWPVIALKTTSDEALKTAMDQRQTKEYVKKNPDRHVMILLEHTNRHPNVAWRVVWGESISTSDFSVFVDASTGKFLEVMR